jgi:transcription termination factor NusB
MNTGKKIKKAIDKLLDAQVIFAEIQGRQTDESEILYWCEFVENCMHMAERLTNRIEADTKKRASESMKKLEENIIRSRYVGE